MTTHATEHGTDVPPPAPAVVVDRVGMTYPGRRGGEPATVLADVSFEVERGRCLVIVGPSGCGKSTLLSCIAGLTRHTAGTITVHGEPVTGPHEQTAVVFQHASLLPWRTVRRNVEFGLDVRRSVPRPEVRSRAAEALRAVGLDGFADHYPHQISGGMQQRTNLARAFALQAPLILMDEPFGALDALTKESMQDQLVGLMARTASSTVFITHDIREALYLGDEVLVMSRRPGRVVARVTSPFAGRERTRAATEEAGFVAMAAELRDLLDHD
jgi:NitT/TauT family transport system ATP-binding protein